MNGPLCIHEVTIVFFFLCKIDYHRTSIMRIDKNDMGENCFKWHSVVEIHQVIDFSSLGFLGCYHSCLHSSEKYQSREKNMYKDESGIFGISSSRGTTWYPCTCSVWQLMKFIVVKFISPRKFLSPIEVNHHNFGNHTALVQGYQVVPNGELIPKIPFPPLYIFFC